MSDDPANPAAPADLSTGTQARAPLSPAARRALAEAEERRQAAQEAAARPREVNGRAGPEPTRFGDWEKNGITSDF